MEANSSAFMLMSKVSVCLFTLFHRGQEEVTFSWKMPTTSLKLNLLVKLCIPKMINYKSVLTFTLRNLARCGFDANVYIEVLNETENTPRTQLASAKAAKIRHGGKEDSEACFRVLSCQTSD
jgi:hypothetical protein